MKGNLSAIFRSGLSKIALVLFAVLTIWWLWIRSLGLEETGDSRQLWAAVYQVIALYGGIVGIFISKRWGGYKSVLGKSILAFSLGLFLQSFGQTTYSYYIFYRHIEIPYPSLGDVGFFGSVIAYIYGALLLSKVSGAGLSLKSFTKKIQAIIIPLFLLGFSYVIFLKGYEFDWSQPIKTFLDFGYPLGQAVYVSIAVATFFVSRSVLGGIMKWPVISLIIALVAQYLADYTFLYQSSRGLWQVGTLNDYLYLISYLFMTLALIYIGGIFHRIQQED